MMNITILGATGSIGEQTLDIIARHSDKYNVVALTANRNHERLFQLCQIFKPTYAVMIEPTAAKSLQTAVTTAGLRTQVLLGAEEQVQVAALDEVECVVAGIVGAAGLLPTLSAIRAGKRVLFANKEPLIMAGDLMMKEMHANGATLLPVDSEHNAIFQCLPMGYMTGNTPSGLRRMILTASGGPFRTMPLADFGKVTPEQACAHPTWRMGRKISVDCATLFNKGLEVIEAHYLFKMPLDQIEVVIHPQSVIHSLVEFYDGSMLAQLGLPDMRIPIANALAWPARIDSGVESMSLTELGSLTFAEVEAERYPCFNLPMQALQAGGTATAIVNAANEIAVSAFLQKHIRFVQIADIIKATLDKVAVEPADQLATIQEADHHARQYAMKCIASSTAIY